MPSLLDAIEAKYGAEDKNEEAPIGIYVPKIGARKSIPRLLILNDFDVDSAGDEDSLEKTCTGVLEIDLAHNRLSSWKEISKILQHTSSVAFLNLSFNSLEAPILDKSFSAFPCLPTLNTLILIGTKISWESVWFLLRRATALSEIHLSLNEFSLVDTSCQVVSASEAGVTSASISDQVYENARDASCFTSGSSPIVARILLEHQESSGSFSDSGHGSSSEDEEVITFPNIKRLMFDGNPISDWGEVSKLGICFPSLKHLGLSDCAISSITREGCQPFENLQSISLSNTPIEDLNDISKLNALLSLNELRLQGIPALCDLTAHERRQMVIAFLPKIKRINGGAPISCQEREDADRAFIRRFSSSSDQPPRYHELVTIHGELAPLVDVQLKPTTKAKVKVCFETRVLERHISVYQTTLELKNALEPLIGITSAKMRLFYSNPELECVFGREEMRFPQKQLYSYNIQDGDEIHVVPKISLTRTPSNEQKCA